MKQVIVLQHTATEGPERIATLLAERGVRCDVRQLFRGDALPEPARDTAPLIVMGGPMAVYDAADPRYPFLAPELELLRAAVAGGRPVLGICLGAQLLAAAAGARVYPNTRGGPDGGPLPAREVGWGAVDFIGVEREPLLAGLRPREMVLHWHGDTFDLPPRAVHLASSELCRHQAFRLGDRQIGLQFHCELEAESIAAWVRDDADYVRATNGDGGGARILADTARWFAEARPVWDRLLRNVLAAVCS